MNLRRGFFRLWLVLSAFFIIGTAVVSFPDVRSEFQKAASLAEFKAGDWVRLVPVNCSDARGKIGDDYSGPNDGTNRCWYTTDKLKALYPEYQDLTDDQLADRLYEKAGILLSHPAPWTLLSKMFSIAIGVPLIVLAVGLTLGWSFAGFSQERLK